MDFHHRLSWFYRGMSGWAEEKFRGISVRICETRKMREFDANLERCCYGRLAK